MLRPTLSILIGLASASSALSQDPFQPGMRWIRGATPLEAWIPSSVGFAADDALVFGTAKGQNGHRFLLDAHDQGAADVRREVDLPAGTLQSRTLGAQNGNLFSMTQVETQNGAQRTTEVSLFQPESLAPGQPMVPTWTHSMGLLSTGVARIVADGEGNLVACALYLPAAGNVVVDVLVASTGALYSRSFHQGVTLDEFVMSADGRRLALTSGPDLFVLDRSGAVLFHENRGVATAALALSGDGLTMAAGRPGALEVYTEDFGFWSLAAQLPAHPQSNQSGDWMPTQVALSHNGATLAMGLWKFTNGYDAAFEIWQAKTQTRTQRLLQASAGNGLQNLPSAISMTANGKRVAFGTWGNGVDPELLLMDRTQGAPVLEVDLPGSVRGLDLDATGTRVVLSHKDTHNNVLSNTGGVRLYDTGERQLQQLGVAELGGNLHLAAKRQNSLISMFLVGTESAPVQVGGVLGKLLLDRSTLTIQLVPSDANGRADLDINVPQDPAWVGTPFAVQAAFRLPHRTALSKHLARPLLLD
ncbi:MAG: hypothetical protein ACI8QC_003223 [Planctomycetota bacterium]|jgi:hypothetical protein